MKVEDIMKKKGDSPLITVDKDMKAIEAVAILDEHKIGALIVVDKDDNVVGIVSERDFLYKAYKQLKEKGVGFFSVGDLMTSADKMYVAQKSDKPHDVMKLMLKKRIRHVPIMDDGVIVGIISVGDLLGYLLEKYEEEAFLLREHIKNPMGIHVYGDNK
ncbi:MAG: CBS domain-containing protein [Chlorobi bacterium]|nr:CBS domain-containing protein [Chlorobiota bacterium]